jgi:glycosyltransferase involved in cell wall biosynthesis
MQNNKLNLIETTLHDLTGHSYSYVQCLLKANEAYNFDMHVWMDRRAKNLLDKSVCTPHPYFYRPLRQLQKIFLYFKLLRQPGVIFVGTSELWDLQILAFFAKHFKPKAKVFVHSHQFKQTPKKIASLKRIAQLGLDFTLVTPTEKLANIFREQGLRCDVLECPTYPPMTNMPNKTAKFSKVLYAGAARSDKGFSDVIKVLKYNRAQGKNTLFEIQISPPSSGRYDAGVQVALQELHALPHRNLILHQDTLTEEQYLHLFENAICLLIYKQKDYHDKFSAVALDSFYAGCPIITAKNTWMGDVAQRYNAGVALDSYAPELVQAAIDKISANYLEYHNNAKRAARELLELHDPKRTLEYIKSA